jgi:hypothetical protein
MKFAQGLLFVFLLLGLFYTTTPDVFAQGLPSEIVTCGGTNPDGSAQGMCKVCDIVELGMNILNFFVFFSTLLATLLFVNAGVLYLFSPANPGNISKAHKIFTNTLIGILIILCAWLVVDTVMKNLYSEGAWGPWNEILCKPGGAAPLQAPTTPTAPPVAVSETCPETPLTPIPAGIALSSNLYCHSCPGGCTVSATMASRLSSLNSRLAGGEFSWRVTEAFPPSGYTTTDPTGIHVSACHGNGTCIDANFVGTTATAARINAFVAAASASGLRAVYEVATAAARTTLVNAGVPTGSIIVVAHITAPHFSVYQ